MKKFFFLAVFAATMISCNNTDEPIPTPVEEKIPINISTSITRVTDSAFESGDKVGI